MYVTRILNINLDLIQVMGAVTGEEKGTEPMLVMELMDHGCEFWVGHDFQVSKISSWFQLLKQMKWLARAHQYIVVDIHQLKSTSDFAKRFTFVIFAIGIPQTLQIQGFCRSIFFTSGKTANPIFAQIDLIITLVCRSLYDLLHNETIVLEGDVLLPILRDIIQVRNCLH